MPIDYAATYSALYTRVTGSSGAAVRALLGGTTSVFPRDQLGNLSGRVLPYLVFAEGGVTGQSEGMRDVLVSWWAYIAPGGNPRTLYQIASELDELYGSMSALAISGGRLGVTYIGRPFHDSALGLQGLEVRVGYRRLG